MTTLTCTRCQDHLFAIDDPSSPLPDDVAEHLLDCADCRQVRDDLAHLDEALTFHAAAQPEVPADFKASLLAKLPPPPERITPAQAAYERVDSARRHQETVAKLERRYLIPHFRSIPRFVSLLGVVVLSVLVLREMARQFELDPILTVGCGAGLLGLGLAIFLLRPDLPRLLQFRWRRNVRAFTSRI